jgi:hypothetical protein
MKTEIWVSFNYGGWSLVFSKEFDFPFTPFLGLRILDEKGDFENMIELANNDYCRTIIDYKVKDNCFIVDIGNIWKYEIAEDVLDDTIKCFTNTDWIRKDTTNVDDLKELMNNNYKRKYE